MKREKIDLLNEKDILVGLIVSDEFCKEISPIIDIKDLQVDYSRVIVSWIKPYFEEFGKAPKTDILKLYRSHISEISNESLQNNILTFIEKLDEKYNSKRNDSYAIQEAIKYLKSRNLQNLSQDIEAYITSGDIDKAESLITRYRKVEKESGESVDLLNDADIVRESFTEEQDKLFSFNGAYGRLVGDIHREDFVAFLASMKVGKTFTLIDCGIEALKNGLNVVMFSLEMSRTNMIKRVWKSLSGQVTEDVEITVPEFVQEGEKYRVEEKIVHKKASSILEVEKKQKSLKRLFRGGNLKIFAEPAYSMTVEKLETKLDDLNHNGFIPDVIIIDYADIMLPSNSRLDYRNQLDDIWKRLRAMAQKRKCAVFTASQASRGAINKEATADMISEDIRKLAHVTSMVSISKDEYCKNHSLAMFSQLAVREGEPITERVIATQCLSLGRPVLDSHWKKDVIIDDSDSVLAEKKRRQK